jgi:hypothetical protein
MRAVGKHGGARPRSGPKPGPATKVVRLPVPITEFAHNLVALRKPGDVSVFFDLKNRKVLHVPMMAWPAACGYPSPAEDYVDKALDFNELLIEPSESPPGLTPIAAICCWIQDCCHLEKHGVRTHGQAHYFSGIRRSGATPV